MEHPKRWDLLLHSQWDAWSTSPCALWQHLAHIPTLKPNIYAPSDPKSPKIHLQSPPPALFQAPHG